MSTGECIAVGFFLAGAVVAPFLMLGGNAINEKTKCGVELCEETKTSLLIGTGRRCDKHWPGGESPMSTEKKSAEMAAAVLKYTREKAPMGTFLYYNSPKYGMRWTEGIEFVATTCDAQWLVDAIGERQTLVREEALQVWRLEEIHGALALSCWDDKPLDRMSSMLVNEYVGDGKHFPRELMPLEVWVRQGVCMLKEED